MENIPPVGRETLAALLSRGPGNVHEIREITGRSESATNRALRQLAETGVIVKTDPDADPADGAPTRWNVNPDIPEEGLAKLIHSDDAAPNAEASATDAPPPGHEIPSEDPPHEASESEPIEDERAKICGNCGAAMPNVCETCWQKTPKYCGDCRRTMPQRRRGEVAEPRILENGLPKLRPGELEVLVLEVMRTQREPQHGIPGWTDKRVGIFLPGRSTGAIANALNKFASSGRCQVINDQPLRFRLVIDDV